MNDFSATVNGMCLEFFDEGHIYLVDGVIVPSITDILKVRFGNKYQNIPKDVLEAAASAGTAVHDAIEAYCKRGEESDLPELRNFKFLQKQYHFDVFGNEIPVVLLDSDGKPIAAGRLDLLLAVNDSSGGLQLGLGDIKRTSTLDKDYLFYQLNLYKIAFEQSTGMSVSFLRGLHLRGDKRRYIEIPVDPMAAWELVNQYFEEGKNESCDFDRQADEGS